MTGAIAAYGFLPFHFAAVAEVDDRAAFLDLVRRLKEQGPELRAEAGPDFPRRFRELLGEVPGVGRIAAEGPYSSIVLPMLMARRLTGRRAILSGMLGTGPVADAIRARLEARGVELRALTPEGKDASIEVSLRDPEERWKETVKLHGEAHRSFRPRYELPDEPVGVFFLSQYSGGRAKAGAAVRRAGGLASLRVGGTGRYRRISDYLKALPAFRHAIVPQRDGTMAKVARELGLPAPEVAARGADEAAAPLASALARSPGGPRLAVLLYDRGALFHVPGLEPVRLETPGSYDRRSRAARLQGACAAFGLAHAGTAHLPPTQTALEAFANASLQAAYHGTEGRPSRYPDADFGPDGDWVVR